MTERLHQPGFQRICSTTQAKRDFLLQLVNWNMPEFLNTLASCVHPGHPILVSIIFMLLSTTNCNNRIMRYCHTKNCTYFLTLRSHPFTLKYSQQHICWKLPVAKLMEIFSYCNNLDPHVGKMQVWCVSHQCILLFQVVLNSGTSVLYYYPSSCFVWPWYMYYLSK